MGSPSSPHICTHQALSVMLSRETLAGLLLPADGMSFPSALLRPQLLGHLADTRSSAQALLHAAATLFRISPPLQRTVSSRNISPSPSPLRRFVCKHKLGKARGPWNHVPAQEGWPHRDKAAGRAMRVLHRGQGVTCTHHSTHVCTHTGSVRTSRAHHCPDSHRTGGSCPSARAGVSTYAHTRTLGSLWTHASATPALGWARRHAVSKAHAEVRHQQAPQRRLTHRLTGEREKREKKAVNAPAGTRGR